MREFHSIPDYISRKTLNKRSCFWSMQNFILSYRRVFENFTSQKQSRKKNAFQHEHEKLSTGQFSLNHVSIGALFCFQEKHPETCNISISVWDCIISLALCDFESAFIERNAICAAWVGKFLTFRRHFWFLKASIQWTLTSHFSFSWK